MKTVVMFLSPIVVDRGEHCTKPKAPTAANDLPAGSAPGLARPLRGGEQRFTVRHHAEGPLQVRGATCTNPGPITGCRSSSTARALRKASRCWGWIGAAACMMALY